APAAPSASAIARPIPELAPVTSALWPCSSNGIEMFMASLSLRPIHDEAVKRSSAKSDNSAGGADDACANRDQFLIERSVMPVGSAGPSDCNAQGETMSNPYNSANDRASVLGPTLYFK